MALEQDYPNLAFILDEVFESAGNLKLALRDGDLDPQELVASIPDEGVRRYLGSLLTALKGLPAEVQQVAEGGPWRMMSLFQGVATRVMALFK